jgi:hypothetical protein
MYSYMNDRLGFVDSYTDWAYVMDDYGNLVHVPFCLGMFYWQEV